MTTEISIDSTLKKEALYQSLIPQIKALIEGETDYIANLANIASALKYAFNFLWVGFYLHKENELVLGPFQGPVACTRIKPGKGVCGTAFSTKEVILVPDVNLFEGHIACSSLTKSEIVLPIFKEKVVAALLDIDSENLNYFNAIDKKYLSEIIHLIESKI